MEQICNRRQWSPCCGSSNFLWTRSLDSNRRHALIWLVNEENAVVLLLKKKRGWVGEGQVLGLALMIHERILVKQKTCILFSIRRSLRRTNIFIRFIIIIQSKFEYLNSPLWFVSWLLTWISICLLMIYLVLCKNNIKYYSYIHED